jgi:hypothetical protein
MSIELLFLLLALWLVAGAVDAWILYSRRRVGWRWLLVCVLTGPLSVAAVFDQIYLVERDDADPESHPAGPPAPRRGTASASSLTSRR